MRSQKTSAEALNSFNDSVSALNSKTTTFTSQISLTAISPDTEIETSAKELNSAVEDFEEATSKLKSDRKALKESAEAYITELKSFNTDIVPLAIETSKIEAIGKKMGEIAVSTSATSSDTALLAEIDRVSGEYAKYTTEMKALDLKNSDAKELRDAFVSVSDQFISMLGEVKTAFINRDRTALNDLQTRMSKLERDNQAITKEDEISKKFSSDGEAMKKIDDARQALNDEINKLNAEAS